MLATEAGYGEFVCAFTTSAPAATCAYYRCESTTRGKLIGKMSLRCCYRGMFFKCFNL